MSLAALKTPDFPPLPAPCYVGEGEDRVRYFEAGSGPPAILIHGQLTTAEDMVIALFGDLAPHHRTIAFDRPGFGESERARFAGDPLAQATRLRGTIKALGVIRPVIVGHSFGTVVALTYAMEWPDEIAGLVLISPLILPEPRMEHLLFGPRFLPGGGDFLAYGPGRVQDAALLPVLWEMMFKPQAMPDVFRAQFPFDLAGEAHSIQALGEDSVQAFPRLTKNFLNLTLCRVPTHILVGTADLVVSPTRHGGLAAAAMPRARFRAVPGMGHMVHHFRPDLVAQAVKDLSAAA